MSLLFPAGFAPLSRGFEQRLAQAHELLVPGMQG